MTKSVDSLGNSNGGGMGMGMGMIRSSMSASTKSLTSSGGSLSSGSSDSLKNGHSGNVVVSTLLNGKKMVNNDCEAAAVNGEFNYNEHYNELAPSVLACYLCKMNLNEPKLLSCLHVFCKSCLNALTINECGDRLPQSISCPKCKQLTQVSFQKKNISN